MKLSVLVPVYNEELTIDELLCAVMAVNLDKQVIVVDDASADGTPAVLERWMDRVSVLCHPVNRGTDGTDRANGLPDL